jgi:transcriptional regulator GlxA family with amidase domain
MDAELALAEMLQELAGLPSSVGASPRQASPWLVRIRDGLVARATSGVSISELADAEGVSLVAVARGFRRAYEMTPRTLVRRVRVQRARALLTDPRRSLPDIALATGFADQSHFTRDFKRETALTPGQYRRLVGARR